MNAYGKIAIVVTLALVVGAVLLAKQDRSDSALDAASGPQAVVPTEGAQPVEATRTGANADLSEDPVSADAPKPVKEDKGRPRLVDLGASKCIPCKMMAPILEELKKEYEGQMDVVFIDVWENRDAVPQYGIRSIPTQIFYDASGKERFRHEGFYSKEDILAKCKELGFGLEAK